MRQEKKDRLRHLCWKAENQNKRKEVPPGSKTVKLSLNMLRDGQPRRKTRLGQRCCCRLTVWKRFFLARNSPFLGCTRSWMGSFWNELITVSKLITALITCLLQTQIGHREGKRLAPNQSQSTAGTEVRLSNQWGCPGQEANSARAAADSLVPWDGHGFLPPPTPPQMPRWAEACRSADLLC